MGEVLDSYTYNSRFFMLFSEKAHQTAERNFIYVKKFQFSFIGVFVY